MRRILLLGGMALGALVCSGTVWAQVPSRVPTGVHLLVEPEREVALALTEAQQSIKRKQFHAAVQLLQLVLDKPEDSFLEHDFLDDHGNRGGTRKEAMRLLTSLPTEVQAAYELEYGAAARQLLSKSVESDDLSGITEVARRFTVTSAGYEATTLLAAKAADGNRPLEAALLLEALRTHPRRTPQLSLQRAVYWIRAGRIGRGMAGLRELRRLDPMGTMRVAGRDVPLPTNDEDAIKWLQSLASRAATASEVPTWSMFGGGPTRNASAAAASPAGGNIWRVSTLEHLTLDGRPEEDRRHRTRFQEALDRGLQSLLEEDRPILPAAQPLVVGDTVVYRTIADVTAVSLLTGELLWRSSMVDQSLARLINSRAAEARMRLGRAPSSLDGHLERRAYRDVAAGTLSSDGRTVFALEDLDTNTNLTVNVFGVSESRPANKLVAYDLSGGRLLWEVGGPLGSKPLELSARYFLGPPLPFKDRLYVIAEAQGALQLLVLQQDADRQSVQVDWSQTLIATDPPLPGHPLRRLSGLSPSFADGVLVCPTSSGAVVAVDEARRTLLWGFQYTSAVRPETQNSPFAIRGQSIDTEFRLQEADKAGRWMDSTPLIVDGKVLITPRDSNLLFCLDLVDGHEIWQMSRDDWMYVACEFEGRVVLVGRHGVAAFQLSDGTPLDSFRVTEVDPTGRGVRIGSLYCLPTASGEIATIDLRTGNILARSKLSDSLVPGNLAAGSGAIVSQSAGEIIGFASLASIEQRIAKLTTDPQDTQALALRGELRLHRGEELAGLSDLRESLKHKPDPHAKLVLATALLAGARAKPERILERAAELEAITDDPQQKNEFLRLYSQALESAGDRRGAFVQLIRLAETAKFLDSLKPAVEAGYSVRSDRSIRARLIEMYTTASADDRVELDRALEQHLTKAATGLVRGEQLERLLRFFSGLPKVDAILLKSVMEIARVDQPRHLELLRPFLRSADLDVAAKATAWQCSELIKSEQWQAAVPLIRQLRLEYADQECLDGKTGQSLADQWSVLDGLRQLLVTGAVWPESAIEVNRSVRNAGLRSNLPAEIVARSGALLAGWSFENDPTGTLLVARDTSGVVRWKVVLPNDGEYNDAELRNLRIPCQIQIRDNWLTVWRLTYFAVIDVSATPSPRVVWQQMLKPAGVSTLDMNQIRRNGRFVPRTTPYFGQVIGITRDTVVFTMGTKLLAGELETGRLVWSRQSLIAGQVDGSADDRVVSIQANGSVTLLRTLDGSRIAKRPVPANSMIWSRGAQQLVFRSTKEGAVFELRDAERDAIVWSHECPGDTQASVIDGEDVAFLQPDGQLRVVRLADKREQFLAELPLKLGTRDKSWFTIQRCPDRDLVLGGERLGLQLDPGGAPPLIAFEGHVCAVSRADGRLLWATTVEKSTFDKTQPPGLPVLLLTSRKAEGQTSGNPFVTRFRMTAEILDKRTGRKLYWTDESTFEAPPRLEPDPEQGRVIANFHDWQLELTFPNGKAKPDK